MELRCFEVTAIKGSMPFGNWFASWLGSCTIFTKLAHFFCNSSAYVEMYPKLS